MIVPYAPPVPADKIHLCQDRNGYNFGHRVCVNGVDIHLLTIYIDIWHTLGLVLFGLRHHKILLIDLHLRLGDMLRAHAHAVAYNLQISETLQRIKYRGETSHISAYGVEVVECRGVFVVVDTLCRYNDLLDIYHARTAFGVVVALGVHQILFGY